MEYDDRETGAVIIQETRDRECAGIPVRRSRGESACATSEYSSGSRAPADNEIAFRQVAEVVLMADAELQLPARRHSVQPTACAEVATPGAPERMAFLLPR